MAGRRVSVRAKKYTLDNTCRTCATIANKSSSLTSIFKCLKASKFRLIDELVSLRVAVEEDDGLPQQICANCVNRLSDVYEFRELCIQSQITLGNYFGQESLTTEYEIENMFESISGLSEKQSKKISKIRQFLGDPIPIKHEVDIVETTSYEQFEENKPSKNNYKKSDAIGKCEKCRKYCHASKIETNTHHCSPENVFVDDTKMLLCCFYCDITFQSRDIMQKHIVTLHPKYRPFTCLTCDENFSSMKRRDAHKKSCDAIKNIHENDELETEIKQEQLSENDGKTTTVQRKALGEDDEINMDVDFLSNDDDQSVAMMNDDCQSNGNDQSAKFKDKTLGRQKKLFTCEICSKNFKQKHHCKKHMQTHLRTKRTTPTCEICGETFPLQSDLKEHGETHHKDYLPFQCEYCGKQFRQSANLTSHISDVHRTTTSCLGKYKANYNTHKLEDIKKRVYYYECPKCPTKCRLLSALHKHVRVHDEDRKFPCSACNKAYTRSEHLSRHVNKAHLKNRKYSCKYCNRAFLDSHSRNTHVRAHENPEHKCSYCNKVYKSSKYLKIHERSHTGEKPYSCLICAKEFTNGIMLARHNLVHTKEENEKMREKVLAADVSATFFKFQVEGENVDECNK